MKYTCNFILERRKDKDGNIITKNVPICADINFKQRLRYATGYRIDVSRWTDIEKVDEETGELIRIQQVKKNSYGTRNKKSVAYNFINNDLKLIQATLFELFRDNQTVTKEMIIIALDEKIKKTKNQTKESEIDTTLWGLLELFTKEPSVSEGRRKIYRNAYNNFKHFEESRKRKINFEDCTPRLIAELEEFLKNDDNSTGKYNHLPPRQRPRKKGLNSRIKILKILACFFKWANKNYGITIDPFNTYKIERESFDTPICLTLEERDFLFDFQPPKPYLERVRDMFYIQCCIGCRVGDFFALTKDNLKDNGTSLEYVPQKTIRESSKVCYVPLTPKVQTILAKYDLPDGRLLPYISPQKYNDYIGELLKEAKLDRKVMVVNRVTFQSEQKPLYEVITSHSARKTFIDILMKKNVSESVISSMSGHVKGSKAFHRYYEVNDKQRREAIEGIE